jgi:hypothetical protein
MLWHQKWAHCDLGRVQTLLATPRDESLPHVIAPKHAHASSCPKPKCAACCLSKTGRASAPTTQVLDTRKRNLNDAVTNPGDVVHLDQYIVSLLRLGRRSPRRSIREEPSSSMGAPVSSITTIKSPYELERHCKARIGLRRVPHSSM